jgi:hypothetical protein
LQSAGQRLLWADSESISSCLADSSQVENYTSGLSVRGLTSDGTSVYWASLDRGYFSELRFTPLTGGDWGLLGCNGGGFGAVVVDSVGSILVDADALYYQSDLGDVVGKVPRAEAP